MASLPNARSIPILTESNITGVAYAYLTELETGADADKKKAIQFIRSSLAWMTNQRDLAEFDNRYYADVLSEIMALVPTVSIPAERDTREVAEWLEANQIKAAVARHPNRWPKRAYIFTSEEESILFKLRWS